MLEFSNAEIISFPGRGAAPASSTPQTRTRSDATQAEARLTRALADLDNALTAQRAAVAAWKSSLVDLSSSTGRLGSSLRDYHDSLGHLSARVDTLRAESVKLESWADNVLARKG